MKATPLISDFSAGELSPWLYGRSEEAVYYKGASKVQNFIPKAQGGFYKRPGTLVIGHTQGNAVARLIPFVVSQTTAYVLEFTNNLIRVWKNGVWLGAGSNIVTTYTTAELSSLQFYPFYPDLFITHQNHAPARIRWTTPDTLTLTTLTYRTNTMTFTGTSTSGSNSITGVNTNELPTESIWLLSGPGIAAGTYITNVQATTGSSPLTYTVALSANAGVGSGAGTFTLTLQPIPFASAGNYPRCCLVSGQRLWFANTANNPQTIYQSIVGIWDASDPGGTTGIVGMAWSDISTFSVPVLQTDSSGQPTTNPATFLPTASFQDQVNDADAGSYSISSDTDDEIAWLANAIDVQVGSASGEWIVPGNSTPNTFGAQLSSRVSAANIQPTFVSGGMLFVQRLGKKVYRFEWQGANNPFVPPEEITFFSEHLFSSNSIQEVATQAAPLRYVWFRRSDGSCAVILWNFTYGIRAWWTFQTSGTIISMAVVPGTDFQSVADRDIIHLCVQRTIGGTTYTFIEQIATPAWTDNRQAIFSDCATYKFNGIKFTTMTVDTALNGATLEVVADGAYIGTAIPQGGVLTLPKGVSANYAVAGFNYTSIVTTMPLVPQTQEGTGQLKKASIPKCRFRVYNTLYMKAGQFLTPASAMSVVRMGDIAIDYTIANPTPYSGYARASILEALRDDTFLSIESDLPLPCSLTAIVPDVEVVE